MRPRVLEPDRIAVWRHGGALTACGETHAAFERRCIPAEPRRFAALCVALRSKYTRYSSLARLVSRAPHRSRRSREFHHRLLAAVFLAAGCAPEAPDIPSYSAEAFYDTEQVFGASFSADETRILMTSDRTGVMNVYSQPVSGGTAETLTSSTTDANLGIAFFPNDDRILFTADQGGNELNHLYVLTAGEAPVDITPGENLKAGFSGFSEDGERFFVTSNERNPQAFDLYEYRAEDVSRRLVFENPGGFQPGPVSGDGRYLAVTKARNNADSDIYLVDLQEPAADPRHLTPHEGDASHGALTFDPEVSELLYATDAHGEFVEAWAYDLEMGEHRPVVQADWDVFTVYFSKTGTYQVSAVNVDASTEVTVVDTRSGETLEFPEVPGGDVSGVSFSPNETKMAFYVNSDTSPSNLYVWDLESGEAQRLTDTLNPAIAEANLVDGEVIRYPSFDGLDIPSILYRPRQATASSPAPALVWVHGGPGGQSRKGYRAQIQHLVNNGYAVLAVNNRGSSGYGKTFFHLDDKRHGDVDLKDCVEARTYLESLDWVDGSRIGIIGGSYGGYMVGAALAFEPEVFDVGVNIFGVMNWVRTLSSIPPWWGAARDSLYAELGDPETELERLTAISPLFHTENIVRPLFVVQGANDPRVLQVESDEIVEAVRKNGVPVEYVIFPDEGHGFRNRDNRIESADRILGFLDTHLREETGK